MNQRAAANALDASGVGLSLVCLAHCLLIPVAAAAAPMLAPGAAHWLGASHDWHLALFLIAAPVAVIGLLWGARLARAGWRTLAAAGFGLVLMGLGAAHVAEGWGEAALTVTGVTILAGAHAANWRARARQGHAHQSECGMCHEGGDPA
ncbi:MAG: MerC domain-containing protein [Maricaulaceae bacterium]|nr:MerC domain-containing protein [Maricaulaceae bacterium]